ncbi:MAG: lipoate--protein ligase [Oscillospiraceae bacterium]|nr:lipoate--protein ligase [Oscillospiraceae bacterium]
MIYIESKLKDAAFNIAAEEYITVSFNRPVFMLWQTEKCVIIGRNQIAAAEIDLREAELSGVNIVRRTSGGGAVFSDAGNIMYTLSTGFKESDDPKKIERELFAEPMARALNKMGVPAVVSGRNDIVLNGRKISGLAQYAKKDRLCTHGSLLYDTDLTLLSKLLKPDPEKINSKALKSVRSRVVNIREYLEENQKNQDFLSVTDFIERLKINLFSEFEIDSEIINYEFSESDIKRINIIKDEKYANQSWTNGTTPRFSVRESKRFPAGKLDIFLDSELGVIKSCGIFGDFLGVLPVGELEKKLAGQPYDYNFISGLLSGINLRLYLGDIKREEFLECLF